MATERQIKANQRNAQLSTGPRTAAGRAKSAQNGRPHGFTSRDALLTTPEDRVAFDAMQDEYLTFYDTGHPDCREYVSAAVNAEFQRRFILRAQKGHFEESVLLTIDQLWGSQRLPEDAAVNHELLTRLIGIAVRRDLRQDEIFLKSSRYAVEQFRVFDRAVKVLRRNLEKNSIPVEPSPTESAEIAADTALAQGATAPAAAESSEAQGFSPGLTNQTPERTTKNNAARRARYRRGWRVQLWPVGGHHVQTRCHRIRRTRTATHRHRSSPER